MTPHSDHSTTKETAVAAWVQTRVVLRIVFLLLAVAALLWIIYKLTTVLLLLVLSIFFAYLVAPLVDLVERPVHIGGRERKMPRGLAIGVVYLFLFTVVGAGVYFLVPQFAAQFPEFKLQANAYYKSITDASDRANQYFTQHRMPPGVVKAVNDTILGVIAKGGEVASLAFEHALGWIIFLPWLVLIPILGFFLLKDADSFRRSALSMLPRGRLRWRGDEFFQDINSTLAAYIRAQLT
ncbi:MAG TPA: AI-2E family transporter, partial [Pyrinomonadaceae bacterium]|nr:AI-2E family transporter [Pyrinomonadaceae bacterium]